MDAISIPFRNHDIYSIEELYGRLELLESLSSYANMLTRIQIIGARRFGKTCSIKTLSTSLKKDSASPVYPVFLDTKSDCVTGTDNVYSYITAVIISDLYNDGLITDPEVEIDEIDNVCIKPHKKWKAVKNAIDCANVDTSEAFCTVADHFHRETGKTFLLLFDEYEHMAKSAFDEVNGFMPIRRLSDLPDSPITFWLIGARKWKDIVKDDPQHTIGGSGEFNQVQEFVFVPPISRQAFDAMWEKECMLIKDDTVRRRLLDNKEDAYSASGGVPFYAKCIGTHLLCDKQFPSFSILEGQFTEMQKSLSCEEIEYLNEYQHNPNCLDTDLVPTAVASLINLGLLKVDDSNIVSVPIGFLSKYLSACRANKKDDNADGDTLLPIVDQIAEYIVTINENLKTAKLSLAFPPTIDGYLLYKHLRTPAISRDLFAPFIGSLYVLCWDNSKDVFYKDATYSSFKNSMFRKSMDRIRHVYGIAHQGQSLDTLPGQKEIGEALAYFTGFPTAPITSEDFVDLQYSILTHFRDELSQLQLAVAKRIKQNS